jgi:hypothetical protein
MLLQQYQHDETGRTTWHQEGQPLPGKGWNKIPGHSKYVKKNKYLTKISTMIKFTEPNQTMEKLKSDKQQPVKADSFTPQPVYRWPNDGGDGTSTLG